MPFYRTCLPTHPKEYSRQYSLSAGCFRAEHVNYITKDPGWKCQAPRGQQLEPLRPIVPTPADKKGMSRAANLQQKGVSRLKKHLCLLFICDVNLKTTRITVQVQIHSKFMLALLLFECTPKKRRNSHLSLAERNLTVLRQPVKSGEGSPKTRVHGECWRQAQIGNKQGLRNTNSCAEKTM